MAPKMHGCWPASARPSMEVQVAEDSRRTAGILSRQAGQRSARKAVGSHLQILRASAPSASAKAANSSTKNREGDILRSFVRFQIVRTVDKPVTAVNGMLPGTGGQISPSQISPDHPAADDESWSCVRSRASRCSLSLSLSLSLSRSLCLPFSPRPPAMVSRVTSLAPQLAQVLLCISASCSASEELGTIADILPVGYTAQQAVNAGRSEPYAAIGLLAFAQGGPTAHCTAFLVAPDTAVVRPWASSSAPECSLWLAVR